MKRYALLLCAISVHLLSSAQDVPRVEVTRMWTTGASEIVTLENEGFESGLGDFINAGAVNWTTTNMEALFGTMSATSNVVFGGQSAILELDVTVPDGYTATVQFYIRADTTQGPDMTDHVRIGFEIDGMAQSNTIIETSWSLRTYFMDEGSHLLAWKVYHQSAISDDIVQAYLDQVVIQYNQNPSFRMADGSEGFGKILMSDAHGNASWKTLSEMTGFDNADGNLVLPITLDGRHQVLTPLKIMDGNGHGVQSSSNTFQGFYASNNDRNGFRAVGNQMHGFEAAGNIKSGFNAMSNAQHGFVASSNTLSGYRAEGNLNSGFEAYNNTEDGFRSDSNGNDGFTAFGNDGDGFYAEGNTRGFHALFNSNDGFYAINNNRGFQANNNGFDGFYATNNLRGFRAYSNDQHGFHAEFNGGTGFYAEDNTEDGFLSEVNMGNGFYALENTLNGLEAKSNLGHGAYFWMNGGDGVYAFDNAGTGFTAEANDDDGFHASSNADDGFVAEENSGDGFYAYNNNGRGFFALSNGGDGYYAGSSGGDGFEAGGSAQNGFHAIVNDGDGLYASTNGGNGVYAYANGFYGVRAHANALDGIYSHTNSGDEGYFSGTVTVTGNLSKGGGSFKIDHPLDPENKFLYHSFVESPDMMNVYNGNVILDANGEAIVQMKAWFEPLNRDFRYQLTPIGGPGPNLYIAEEIHDNNFKIAGGTPGLKVSWQVTGIRQDLYANHNRIEVEVEKPAEFKGYYLHPEVYEQPFEKGFDYVKQGFRIPD